MNRPFFSVSQRFPFLRMGLQKATFRLQHAESSENAQVNLVEVEVAALDADIKVVISAAHSRSYF